MPFHLTMLFVACSGSYETQRLTKTLITRQVSSGSAATCPSSMPHRTALPACRVALLLSSKGGVLSAAAVCCLWRHRSSPHLAMVGVQALLGVVLLCV